MDPHLPLAADVTDSPSLSRLAGEVERKLGGCDVLVNGAGVTRFVPHDDLDALDDELIDTILRTNVRGAFACVRALRSLLDRSELPGGAVVVNISSIAAVTGQGSNVAYCASKAALDSITRSLGRALAPRIRVVSVSPGVVDTGFIRSLDPAWRDDQLARTPLGRLARPTRSPPPSSPSSATSHSPPAASSRSTAGDDWHERDPRPGRSPW